MGAHGTLEEALANVASFATASQVSKSSGSKHLSSKSSKHKTHKKHKKSKDKSKEKKGTHKKHRKIDQGSSSEGSSDDEGHPLDLNTQLARGREAARITRRILTEYPDMRADLRQVAAWTTAAWVNCSCLPCLKLTYFHLQLLGRIDGGAALAIDQIPSKSLQHLLASLFDNLLLKRTKQAGAGSQ